jgi:hypothetical protein
MRDIKINRHPIFLSRYFSVSCSGLIAALPRCEISASTERQASGNRKVFLPTIRVTTVMNPNQANTDRNHPNDCQYALCRGVAYWALVFQSQEAIFKHELGALYVAHLLLDPPSEPIHAVALALKARESAGRVADPPNQSRCCREERGSWFRPQ